MTDLQLQDPQVLELNDPQILDDVLADADTIAGHAVQQREAAAGYDLDAKKHEGQIAELEGVIARATKELEDARNDLTESTGARDRNIQAAEKNEKKAADMRVMVKATRTLLANQTNDEAPGELVANGPADTQQFPTVAPGSPS